MRFVLHIVDGVVVDDSDPRRLLLPLQMTRRRRYWYQSDCWWSRMRNHLHDYHLYHFDCCGYSRLQFETGSGRRRPIDVEDRSAAPPNCKRPVPEFVGGNRASILASHCARISVAFVAGLCCCCYDRECCRHCHCCQSRPSPYCHPWIVAT